MQTLNVSLIQTALHWEDVDANLDMFSKKIESIEGADIIVLPEMFNTGFTMNSTTMAELIGGKTTQWMKGQAAKKNAVITGSIIVEEGGKHFNRLIWMQPDGMFYTYDKRHLFRMGNEHEHYSAGNKKLIVEYKGWRICPMICYDLRFPVWIRNKNEYDLLLFVANWPTRRNHHWKQLLIARSIENQCYTLGVNRVGDDGNGIGHSGPTMAVDPLGKVLVEQYDEEAILSTQLDLKLVQEYRTKFPASMDADDFDIKN